MHLVSGWLIGRIVAVNQVPDAVASPELEAKLAQDEEPEPPLMTEQQQELLIMVLEENGSLGKNEGVEERDQGQDEPFKERFRRIAPHEVEEMHNTSKRCWVEEPYVPHSNHGVMLLSWYRRRMGPSGSA